MCGAKSRRESCLASHPSASPALTLRTLSLSAQHGTAANMSYEYMVPRISWLPSHNVKQYLHRETLLIYLHIGRLLQYIMYTETGRWCTYIERRCCSNNIKTGCCSTFTETGFCCTYTETGCCCTYTETGCCCTYTETGCCCTYSETGCFSKYVCIKGKVVAMQRLLQYRPIQRGCCST